jgi:prepilin-type N-terminal cleavage/methylation domain-containing protein
MSYKVGGVMKRLLRNKKGMSLLEVMIAITVLGLLTMPIMISFMNTQRYAKKIDKETEISSITRTVKQLVVDGLVKNEPLVDKDGNSIDIYVSDTIDDKFRDFIKYCRSAANKDTLIESVELMIYSGGSQNTKYSYKLAYHHNEFYDGTQYPNVYNVLIKIIERDSGSVVNQIKIAVKVDNF